MKKPLKITLAILAIALFGFGFSNLYSTLNARHFALITDETTANSDLTPQTLAAAPAESQTQTLPAATTAAAPTTTAKPAATTTVTTTAAPTTTATTAAPTATTAASTPIDTTASASLPRPK